MPWADENGWVSLGTTAGVLTLAAPREQYWYATTSTTTTVWPTWSVPVRWTSASNQTAYTWSASYSSPYIVSLAGEVARGVNEITGLTPAQAEHQEAVARVQHAADRVVAESRGSDLLLSLLPEDQREAYRLSGEFELIGSHGGRYRIRRGTAGNIDWLNDAGDVAGCLCAHPTMRDGWLPTADVMLAQMLALTADEAEFVRLANVHRGQRPTHLAGIPNGQRAGV